MTDNTNNTTDNTNTNVEGPRMIDTLTAKEIKELVSILNGETGAKPGDKGYVATRGKKDELVSALAKSEYLNSDEGGQISVQNNQTTLDNDQLEYHAQNYRNELDYYSPVMVQRFLDSNLEFFQPIVVTATGEQTEDGRPKYRIVSGNRSRYNYLMACEKAGVDPGQIPVSIRTYSSEDGQSAYLAETLEIGLANEIQLKQSPIDLMRWFKELGEGGLKQSAIATRVYGPIDGKAKQSVISRTLKYDLLPTEIQRLVHIDFNSGTYAANGKEWCVENNVPFTESEDGEIQVVGLTQSAAGKMMDLYPRTNAENASEGIEAVNEFLLSDPEIIQVAQEEKASNFGKYLKKKAGEAGLLPETKKAGTGPALEGNGVKLTGAEPGTNSSEEAEASGTEAAQDSTEGDGFPDPFASEDGPSEPKVTYRNSVDISRKEAILDLKNAQYEPAGDFAERLAELIDEDELDALNFFRFLRFHNLLLDV